MAVDTVDRPAARANAALYAELEALPERMVGEIIGGKLDAPPFEAHTFLLDVLWVPGDAPSAEDI